VGKFNVIIKDKTKLLDVPFTYTESGSGAVFIGTLKLKRTDFGIGSSSMVMSDDVTVSIDVAVSK
jgi:polyisoprenoid-binding protein YceI